MANTKKTPLTTTRKKMRGHRTQRAKSAASEPAVKNPCETTQEITNSPRSDVLGETIGRNFTKPVTGEHAMQFDRCSPTRRKSTKTRPEIIGINHSSKDQQCRPTQRLAKRSLKRKRGRKSHKREGRWTEPIAHATNPRSEAASQSERPAPHPFSGDTHKNW